MPRISIPPSPRPRIFFQWTWVQALIAAALGQLCLSQAQWSWTLWPGIALMGLGAWRFYHTSKTFMPPEGADPPFRFKEATAFLFILLLGWFFRSFELDSLPPGLHTDQGFLGLGALRILHEGWRPFGEMYATQVPEILLPYQLAGWFGCFGPSLRNFHAFYVLLSLALFPLAYWTWRQWAGAAVALASLFFLAIMRWHWVETRNAHPCLQTAFYLFGSLSFFYYAARQRKAVFLIPSAFFCGLGLYAYQVLKLVPILMAVLAFWEWRHSKRGLSGRILSAYLLAIFLMGAPLLYHVFEEGSVGQRERQVFLWDQPGGNTLALWKASGEGVLSMFNREGSSDPYHNLPGHRMLDDVTALLMILGLAFIWRKRREPDAFYALAGFGCMVLPGFITIDPGAPNRMEGAVPFIAFFAGSASVSLFNSLKQQVPSWTSKTLGALVLIVATAQNAYTYFVFQAQDPRCRTAFGLEQTFIGQSIAQASSQAPGRFHFLVDPFYSHNPTVEFLGYGAKKDTGELDLNAFADASLPRDKDLLVFLGGPKTGIVDWWTGLYPDAMVQKDSDPSEGTLLYEMEIPQKDLMKQKPWPRGLEGTYILSNDWRAEPLVVRRDYLINFASAADLPFRQLPPWRVRWTGTLNAPLKGAYRFQVLTTDRAALWLDGKPVALAEPLQFKKGVHRFRLEFEKDSGYYAALHLVWQKPGSDGWEVVPAADFGSPP